MLRRVVAERVDPSGRRVAPQHHAGRTRSTWILAVAASAAAIALGGVTVGGWHDLRPVRLVTSAAGLGVEPPAVSDARRSLHRLEQAVSRHDLPAVAAGVTDLQRRLATLGPEDRRELSEDAAAPLARAEALLHPTPAPGPAPNSFGQAGVPSAGTAVTPSATSTPSAGAQSPTAIVSTTTTIEEGRHHDGGDGGSGSSPNGPPSRAASTPPSTAPPAPLPTLGEGHSGSDDGGHDGGRGPSTHSSNGDGPAPVASHGDGGDGG
jgi:hypothetical protein